jgi:hypothetical protein
MTQDPDPLGVKGRNPMQITKTSPFSGKTTTLDLDVTDAQLARWRGGELAQNVFPHLTADEREFLMTGIAPGEFEAFLGPEE